MGKRKDIKYIWMIMSVSWGGMLATLQFIFNSYTWPWQIREVSSLAPMRPAPMALTEVSRLAHTMTTSPTWVIIGGWIVGAFFFGLLLLGLAAAFPWLRSFSITDLVTGVQHD